MAIELKKNVFPIEVLAQNTSYFICQGCHLQKAINDVKALVAANPKYFDQVPELLTVAEQNYDIQATNEVVQDLDTLGYSITLAGREIISRVGDQKIISRLPERKFCVIF